VRLSSNTPSILARFPHFDDAKPVAEIEANQLDPETFQREYVRLNRPIVVRGAAKHWVACSEWGLPRLQRRLSRVTDLFSRSQGLVESPLREYAGRRKVGEERDKLYRQRPRGKAAHALSFLERLDRGDECTAYGVSLTTRGIEPLRKDLGPVDFEPNLLNLKSFLYDARMFLYRGGYTDWHFHYADETITVQIRGTKDFLLLPTDRATFDTLWKTCKSYGFWEDAALENTELQSLMPYRLRLYPGDAVYLPVFWWHAVQPGNQDFGVTIAFPFAASYAVQFDPRFKAARWNIAQAWRKRRYRRLLPALLLGGCVALFRHPFAPPHINT